MGKIIKLQFRDGTPFLLNTNSIKFVKIVIGNVEIKSSITLVDGANIPVKESIDEIHELTSS